MAAARKRSAAVYFTAAAILLGAIAGSQFQMRVPSRPRGTVSELLALRSRVDLSLVFIVVDTLRADRMSLYGYRRRTTPVIDALAQSGITFERVIAQSSWTKTSMASLWTATYPAANGVSRFDSALPAAAEMPAEILERTGYRTVGIWRNGWVAANFGFDQGFDVYYTPKAGTADRLERRSPAAASIGGTDEDVLIAARDFLEQFGERKFFLYLHLMDLHQYVFDDDADDFGPSYSDAYDRALDWTDRVIGAIVQALDDSGAMARTVVAIASDHGEAFLEHGREGHGYDLHREVVEVPFVIIAPLRLEPGIRVAETIGNVDVWPTLLDLLGAPPLAGVDGRSQLPRIIAAHDASNRRGSAEPARPVISQLDQHWGGRGAPRLLVSITDADARLIVQPGQIDSAALYDRRADPLEAANRAARDPTKLRAMLEQIDAHLQSAAPPWGAESETVDVDALRLDQLRALGYRVGS
ncbi:MAG TPA: sulfatase [Myxococcota bacterium]|nr:sulfatase [Myxococcota bacterium]